MFRTAVLLLPRRPLTLCKPHTTRLRKRNIPNDWRIIEGSPGGVDLYFYNDKTGEDPEYYPDGMTAEELLNVRGARRYFRTKREAELFMAEMDASREKYRCKDAKASDEAPKPGQSEEKDARVRGE